MAPRHRIQIRRCTDPDGFPGHRAECSCGESGPVRISRSVAGWDRDQHIKSLPPVPPGAACKHPKEHRSQPWDRCGLCAGQGSLLDLLEEAS